MKESDTAPLHAQVPRELKRRLRVVLAREERPYVNWLRECIENYVEEAELRHISPTHATRSQPREATYAEAI